MTKQIADILLQIQYGNRYGGAPDVSNMIRVGGIWEKVDPFEDTYEGQCQAQALIEHFRVEHNELWVESKSEVMPPFAECQPTWWQHALARLKYCIDNVTE